MKPVPRRDLLRLHLAGCGLLALQAVLIAYFATSVLFVMGLLGGIVIPAGDVLVHISLSLLFLALFPGQRIWSLRLCDCHGQPRTIVGPPSEFELYHGVRMFDA